MRGVPRPAVSPHAPGPEWTGVGPGVYRRDTSMALDTSAESIDTTGAWHTVEPISGIGAGLQPVFLDLETSGLSGGAGSVAFLVGLGRLRPGAVTVTQFFLTDFAAEPALIDAVHDVLSEARAPLYITYNGGSFDLPVMRTRFIMSRRHFPEAAHWDLLHLTRRLYRHRLGSCTLGRVERLVLGLSRDEDVPGQEVPARYLRFLETGDPAEVQGVAAHHFYDVANLAVLALRLNGILRRAVEHGEADDADRLGLARLFLQRGGPEHLAICRRVLDGELEETARRRNELRAAVTGRGLASRLARTAGPRWLASRELAAVVARRRGADTELIALRWELFRERGSRHDAIELAKALEHRSKAYRRAVEVLDHWQGRNDPSHRDLEIEHRRRRLLRRTGDLP